MFNKNYIIGGVVVVAVIGAIIWSFSRDTVSVSNSTALEQGVKNLTREKAAEMIKTSFGVQPQYGASFEKIVNADYDEKTGSYGLEGVYISSLEKEGFIKLLPKENNWDFQPRISFTEKAKPYLKVMEVKGISGTYMILAEVVSVEVTGITDASQENGITGRIADFTAKFKPTPIGVAIDEKKAAEDIKSQMPFVLYDDGWRIQE